MRKILLILCTLVLCVTSCFVLFGCNDKEKEVFDKVTFMNGETQVAVASSKKELEEILGRKVTKEGYKLSGLFLDKECTKPYDPKNAPKGEYSLYYGWLPSENFYNKINANIDAKINTGMLPVVFEGDAEISYRLTEDGIDMIIDAAAIVGGEDYDVDIYYIDGDFVVGYKEGDEEIEYEGYHIGTLKELYTKLVNEIKKDPKAEAVYNFIVDLIEKNNIEFDMENLSAEFALHPDIKKSFSYDMAPYIKNLIDYILENKEEQVYDCVLRAIVERKGIPEGEQEKEINKIKNDVNVFLEELLSDDITVGEFVNKILSLLDTDIDSIIATINGLQAQYKIETKDVIELIEILAEEELPEVQNGQTLLDYLFAQINPLVQDAFQVNTVFDIKVCDLLSSIMGTPAPFSLENEALPAIQYFLNNTTVEDFIQKAVKFFDMDFFAFEVFDKLASINIEKLKIEGSVETDESGLLKELTFNTEDAISLGQEDTVSVKLAFKVAFEYDVYGENVFTLPESSISKIEQIG